MITREDVKDLRPGDVVQMSWLAAGGKITVSGPLLNGAGAELSVAGYWVRERDGSPIQALAAGLRSLTVVSRAPRPLYVNSDRTEPVPGDVVRDADDDETDVTWRYTWTECGPLGWQALPIRNDGGLPARLRLLVDGTTGQAVTS